MPRACLRFWVRTRWEMKAKENNCWARTEWLRVDGRPVRLFAAPPESLPRPFADSPLRLPLLFIHGLGCSGETWEPSLKEIDRRGLGCTIYAPDMPGYGRSEGPREAFGIPELADWLTRLLDACDVPRAHLVGNSMGCQVALAMARRSPERVGGLVLQGATTGERIEPAWRYVLGLLADTFHENPAYTMRLMKMYAQMGPVRYMTTVRKMLQDDPFEHIDAITAPTLIIRGGRDAIIPDMVARRLTAELPDAVYLPLDSAAHAIEFNNPVEFVDAVLNFLTRAEEKLGISARAAA